MSLTKKVEEILIAETSLLAMYWFDCTTTERCVADWGGPRPWDCLPVAERYPVVRHKPGTVVPFSMLPSTDSKDGATGVP